MSIFDEFHQALSNAVDNYRAEKAKKNKTLSEKRQRQINTFKRLLDTHQSREQRSVLILHEAVVEFINHLEVYWLKDLLAPIYDSAFRSQIRRVLEMPEYTSRHLTARELAENYAWQKRILENVDYQNVAKVLQENDRLTTELAEKNAKIDDLEREVRIKGATAKRALDERNSMRTENIHLKLENATHKEKYDQLKNRYEQAEARILELEAELTKSERRNSKPENTARDREKEPTSYQPTGVFSNR